MPPPPAAHADDDAIPPASTLLDRVADGGVGRTVATAGAGGKPTLMAALARACLAAKMPVVLTSTTHLHRGAAFTAWPAVMLSSGDTVAPLAAPLRSDGVVVAVSEPWGEQMWHGVSPETLDAIHHAYPDACLLVKADGARKRLLKAPADHEPRWPPVPDPCVLVLSLAACGAPLDDRAVHRLDRVRALTREASIGPATLAAVATAGYGDRFPAGSRRILYLSSADRPSRLTAAEAVAAEVAGRFDRVIAGDTPSGTCRQLHPVPRPGDPEG